MVSEFSKKLTVMANDEVYKSTKEKMTLVEQESKKSWLESILLAGSIFRLYVVV